MSKITFTQQSNGSYVAEKTVSADFNLHVEFNEASASQAAFAVQVEAKIAGTKYALVAGLNGVVIDEDFDGVVYPKDIRIVTGREVSDAYITEKA